jgi:hypothetical protein
MSQAYGFADVAIAATAKCFGSTIPTTNVHHFQPPDVPFLDPFAALSPPRQLTRRRGVAFAPATANHRRHKA